MFGVFLAPVPHHGCLKYTRNKECSDEKRVLNDVFNEHSQVAHPVIPVDLCFTARYKLISTQLPTLLS